MTSNSHKPFLRNALSKKRGTAFSLPHAFACARKGVVSVFKAERNMKIHVLAAVVVLGAALVLKLSGGQIALLLLCIGLVMAFECMNTALESVVDLVSPEWHELARQAKDAAAGAVLIAALTAALVGLLIFVPAVMGALAL